MKATLRLILMAVLFGALVSAQNPLADSLPALKSLKIRKIPDGAADYSRFCSFCHGVSGAGDGLNAFNLPIRPRNFTDTTEFKNANSGHLYEVILNGGAANRLSRDMPSWGATLDSLRIKDLVHYIQNLREP